jgi:HTH-type transcriptional regulator/antitoxin HigA
MTIKPIRNDHDLRRAFLRLEKIFQAAEGTPQADERDVLVTLIEAYENKHYDFGQSGRVSEVLNRRRPLSLRMVKRLHDGLKIPYESLMAGVQ